MKILCITDLHGSRKALERILEAAAPVDIILFGGDITHFGTPARVEPLITRAVETGAKVLAVAGNCDSAEIDRHLDALGVSLSGTGLVFDELALQGLPAMPPWGHTMYQFTEEELAEKLEAGYAKIADAASDESTTHIVLSHAPPRGGRLDRTRLFQHVGSTSLRRFVDERQPALVFCGHIHESRGIERSDATTIVNCGVGKSGYYGLADVTPGGSTGDSIAVEIHRA